MKLKKNFSLIELMTVVLVILLLMSLAIPVFINLKMNARTALCKNQMKQLGVLITSYITDNGGYLPNDDIADIPAPVNNNAWWVGEVDKLNNNLYNNWNGHLLPYIDINLTDKYTRYANVNLVKPSGGSWLATTLPLPVAPKTVLNQGWVVMEDAVKNGGYQDLKLFVCPEVHRNTIDIDISNKYEGYKIPRISLMLNGTGLGVPATYLANNTFFGKNSAWSAPVNSYRLDQINNISQKAFILEGGLANGSEWTGARDIYYNLGRLPYEGYDLGTGHPGDCENRFTKANIQFQKLNYVHDNYQFWISKNGNIPNFGPDYVNYRHEIALKFNARYAGKAYMIPCTIDSSSWDPPYTIVSYVDPQKGAYFKDFLTSNPGIGTTFGDFVEFSDEPNEYHYLVGNMNVLFGDNSVSTKDLGWLSCNRIKIGQPTNE